MATRLQTMKALAIEEAKKLKKHLTDDEKGRLDERFFDGDSASQCIYGLATGHCESVRAGELILRCAKRVYENKGLNRAQIRLNGKPYTTPGRRLREYTSPIETLIFPSNLGNEAGIKIIRFIKGETKTLSL